MSSKICYEKDKKVIEMKLEKFYAQIHVKIALFHTFHSKQFIAHAAYQYYLNTCSDDRINCFYCLISLISFFTKLPCRKPVYKIHVL